MKLGITIDQKLEDYERKLDLLQYNTRKRILVDVYLYMKHTYQKEIRLINTAEHEAFNIICDRIKYNHHYTLGF